MITTLEPILIEVSRMLGETSTDISTKRIGYVNRAFNYVVSQHKWSARRKEQILPLVAGTSTYDLTSSVNVTDGDYDTEAGIFEIYNGTTQIFPCDYSNRETNSTVELFTLTPDSKTLVFTKGISGTEDYHIWYYAKHTEPASYTTTLKLALPDSFKIPLSTYTKHLVHDGRRQRNDARNCILDVQEQLDDLRFSDAKHRIKGLPRNIPTVMGASRFRRTYRF